MIGTRRQPSEITQLLSSINGPFQKQPAQQVQCLNGLQDGLQRGNTQTRPLETLPESLRQLITAQSKGIRSSALKIVGALGLSDSPEMAAIFSEAAQRARDESASLDVRIAAMDIVANGPGRDFDSDCN